MTNAKVVDIKELSKPILSFKVEIEKRSKTYARVKVGMYKNGFLKKDDWFYVDTWIFKVDGKARRAANKLIKKWKKEIKENENKRIVYYMN